VLVTVPLLALVERSLRVDGSYGLTAWRSLANDEIRPGLRLGIDPIGALWRSLTTAVWATLFAVVIGAVAVIAITRCDGSGRLLDTGLMLPLGTSAVTIGFGMLITFDTPPVDWRASWWLVPVGHALVAVPFVVRSTLGVARSVDPDLQERRRDARRAPDRAWAPRSCRRSGVRSRRRPVSPPRSRSASSARPASSAARVPTRCRSRSSGCSDAPAGCSRHRRSRSRPSSPLLTMVIVMVVDRAGGTRRPRCSTS
jgi:hypothetical protein